MAASLNVGSLLTARTKWERKRERKKQKRKVLLSVLVSYLWFSAAIVFTFATQSVCVCLYSISRFPMPCSNCVVTANMIANEISFDGTIRSINHHKLFVSNNRASERKRDAESRLQHDEQPNERTRRKLIDARDFPLARTLHSFVWFHLFLVPIWKAELRKVAVVDFNVRNEKIICHLFPMLCFCLLSLVMSCVCV